MLARLTRNFGAQLVTVGVSFLDRFMVVGLLIRAMGNDAYADWALLVSTAGLLGFAELGLNIYYGNVWQQSDATGDQRRFQRMLHVSLGCSALLTLVLGLVSALVALTTDLTTALSLKTVRPTEAALVFCLLAAAVASRAARGGISQLYRGRRIYARGTLVDLLFPLSLIIALPVVALSGGSLLVLAGAYLACDLLAGWGLMLLDLRRRFPELSFRPAVPDRREVLDLVRQVRWFAVQQGAPVAWLQVPVLIVGAVGVTSAALVSFVILRTLVNFARQLASMLSISAGVELATSFHAGNRSEVAGKLAAFGTVLCGAAGACAAAIWVFGEAFVGVWTGQAGLFDPTIIGWLLLAALVAAPATPLSAMLMLGNQPRAAALANLVQLGIGLPAAALLARRYGAAGAAAGLAIGEAVAFGAVLPAFAARHLGLDTLHYLGRCILTLSVSAVWCMGIGLGVHRLLEPASLPGLVVAGLLWGVLGFLPALVAALAAAQHATVVAAWQRLRHR